ncbi:hypothetical protein K1719_015944 [Acacia pycnantha]|nr:hypothetical protein K1719_015944 [Acacia pycnantha]
MGAAMGACASTPAPASASSSQVPCGKYHVFISFRGPDVRFGFLSHLKEELRRKNINFFVDDRLERGEEISSSLVNAIEGSMIALVIFSKDYASSRWCLDELVKIMKCKEDGQQIVIPVFYLVDPSDVRHQKRTYAKPFSLHKKMFKDEVKIWRSVLKNSANLAGYDSSKFQEESKLIDAIVEGVREKLVYNSPFVPNSQLIGSCQNVTIIESLMEIKSQEVRLVGIWGMGGIGKTTLARDICDRFSSKFERYCFLENVRKRSTDGLNLHDELLSHLLDQDERGNSPLKRLQLKKVLIGLDDVDNPKHLKDLVGLLQLGQGSRVIVTSRDKHVLRSGGIHDQFIHGVNELSSKESLELFSRHAFNQSQPKEGYEKLTQEIVDIAKGIPLALVVLGAHLYDRDKSYWESELSKLEMYPRKKIQDILEISYHGLDPMDKKIFLEIAFFLVGHKKDNVTCYLEACGFKAVSGIQNLIDKALIKLGWDGRIVMHDLIQEMAEQIACEERKRHPKKPSGRLKDANEIYDVLKSNKGTDEIEGIILDLSKIKYVQVEADIFVKMKNLRFLKFFYSTFVWPGSSPCIDLPFDLDPFSNNLKYLHWVNYPLETLPSGSSLENLVELRMQNSNVKRLWDGKQDVGNLKTINLSGSYQLIELPDLSMAHKLESVYLNHCRSLRSVHPSILSLPNIIVMYVVGCFKLESIESETHLECFIGYYEMKICLSSDKLSRLCLEETEEEILHFPIGRFQEIKHIRICGGIGGSVSIDALRCLTNLEGVEVTNLKQVSDIKLLLSLFDAWRNLRQLSLEGCCYLSEIPDNIKAFTRLECLSLNDSAVETLPACVSHLSSLVFICLRRCKRLKSILGLPPFLQELDASECTLLETVSSDSLVRDKCIFNFCNCEKLDEHSLRYIQELILSSMTSAKRRYLSPVTACYPGSRVPDWMEYKTMTEAFNATEFTCNLEQSHHLLICCVAPPRLVSERLSRVHCYYSYDDKKKVHNSWPSFCYCSALNRDHVFLCLANTSFYDSAIGNDAKISCELFLEYTDDYGDDEEEYYGDEEEEDYEDDEEEDYGDDEEEDYDEDEEEEDYGDDEEEDYCKVPAKACGAHVIYYS